MKKLTLLFFLLFSLLSAYAVKKIDANPINVAFMLAKETDSVKMASTCKYYGYELVPSKNGYIVYTHHNGSIIRYTFKDATNNQPYPQVEVKSKMNSKDIDFTLTDLNFKKVGSAYERKQGRYARTFFICKHGSGGFLIFHQIRIPKE